jgi:hypothetical protein
MTEPRIESPALLVYAFAALDGAQNLAQSGWAALDDLWRACRVIGPSIEPLLSVSSPDHLPDPPSGSGSFRIIASARRTTPGRIRSVFVFTEHGTAGLVAAISADSDGIDAWNELVASWQQIAPTSDALLGQVTVLLGLSDDSLPEIADRLVTGFGLRAELPPAEHGPNGALLWDIDQFEGSRVLVVAAPRQAEKAVDSWAWAVDGRQGLTPLTRYCLNVYRAHHQRHLYQSLRPLSELVAETDTAITALAEQLTAADDPNTSSTELVSADQRVQRTQLGAAGLLWRLTKIQEMTTGVHALHANTRRHRPEQTIPGGMFDRDDKTLTWVR